MKNAYQIHTRDNVATVIVDVEASEEVEVVSLQGDVISKMTLKEKIIKYGEIIGVASDAISPGDWVHTHNVDSDRMSVGTEEANQ